MPAALGSAAKLYVGGVDLSAYMREGGASLSAETVDITTWGSAVANNLARTYMAGRLDGTWAGGGIFDFDETNLNRPDSVLPALLGAGAKMVHLPAGDSAGAPAYIIDAGGGMTSYEITTPTDDVGQFSIEAQGSGLTTGVSRGVSLHPQAGSLSITIGGNDSGIDDQPWKTSLWPTTAGAVAMLHVLNKGGGAGTLTVKVQHASVLGGPYVDLVTFAGQTAIRGSDVQYVAAGTTINQFLRALWTLTGGTWDISVTFARRQ